MSKAQVEFDHWIICPKCMTAMVGEEGEICFICGTKTEATPLYPDIPQDVESARITAGIQKKRAEQAQRRLSDEEMLVELGVEYTPDELELLAEMGLA